MRNISPPFLQFETVTNHEDKAECIYASTYCVCNTACNDTSMYANCARPYMHTYICVCKLRAMGVCAVYASPLKSHCGVGVSQGSLLRPQLFF